MAEKLSPEIAATFGAIHVKDAGGEREVWTAYGWQEDGSWVNLEIDPVLRMVELHAATRSLERPVPNSRWVDRALIGIVVASVALGLVLRSALAAVAFLVVVIGGWIAWDIRRQIGRERRRTIDGDAWNQRLRVAVEHASEQECQKGRSLDELPHGSASS